MSKLMISHLFLLFVVSNPILAQDIELKVPENASINRLIDIEVVTTGENVTLMVFQANTALDTIVTDDAVRGGSKPNSYIFAYDPGTYRIIALAILNNEIVKAEKQIIIGEPGPVPGPGPGPVPIDEFDNVGQLTFKLVSQLPAPARAKATEMANIYKAAADGLESGEYINVTAASQWIFTQRTKVMGEYANDWQKVVDGISVTWNKFWPMDKAKVAKFYRAAAIGMINQ